MLCNISLTTKRGFHCFPARERSLLSEGSLLSIITRRLPSSLLLTGGLYSQDCMVFHIRSCTGLIKSWNFVQVAFSRTAFSSHIISLFTYNELFSFLFCRERPDSNAKRQPVLP